MGYQYSKYDRQDHSGWNLLEIISFKILFFKKIDNHYIHKSHKIS